MSKQGGNSVRLQSRCWCIVGSTAGLGNVGCPRVCMQSVRATLRLQCINMQVLRSIIAKLLHASSVGELGANSHSTLYVGLLASYKDTSM
jgi:hypothetical protein